MSILDKASLIQIPSGYKSTKLYSLRPINGDGDFTFSRSSSGTRVNSEGLIEVAKVIGTTEEVANGNFVTNSDWSGSASISSGQLTKTSGGLAYQGGVVTANKYYKVVVDVESLDGATQLYFGGNQYTLSVGVQTIEAVGGTSNTFVGFNNGYSSGSGSVFNSISVKQYIENDVPRLDYSGGASCASLLLEPQRTNLVTYSESFDNAAWTKSGVTISANSTTSPDGTTNADKIIASSGVSVKIAYQVISSTNSVAHTVSAFYKADEYSYAFLRIGGQTPSPYVIYNLLNQSVVSTANATSTKIEDYGSGWYRVSMTYTANSVTNAPNISFLPTSGYTLDSANQPSYNGDGSSGGYIYGAQLEQGSYPTSYIISNSGSQTTRSADVCNNAGTSATFNSTEGVLFAEIAALYDDLTTNRGIAISDGTSSNRVLIYYSNDSNQINAIYTYNGTTQVNITKVLSDSTQFTKFAFKYKENDCAFWIDGIEVGTDNTATAFAADTLDTLNFDSGSGGSDFYGKTKQLMVFNEALSDEELSDLTGQVNLSFNNLATFYGYTIL